jgi:hypothetical protein
MESPSQLIRPDSSEDILSRTRRLRIEMEERFHLYEEVRALSPGDRDALFKILFDAQNGDHTALEAILDLVYDEFPVDMEEFIFSPTYLGLKGDIDVEKVEILNLFDRPETRKIWLGIGSGGGKSFVVSIAMARMVYRLLCLKRPDMFYMLGPGSKIAIINLSVSKDQARDVIFSEFLARVKNSPWFAKRYRPWSSRARFQKQVWAFSGGSGAVAYYGYHTIMGSLDEASWMMDRNDRSVAEELTEAMMKSLNTRFPRAHKLLEISSLRSPDDYLYNQIERVKEEGQEIQIRRTPGFANYDPAELLRRTGIGYSGKVE